MVKTLYAGIDESNHGRFPEIYVSAFHNAKKLITEKEMLPKIRHHKNTEDLLEKIDYSFVILRKDDLERLDKRQAQGFIISSLVYRKRRAARNIGLSVFIDGEVPTSNLIYAKDIVSSMCEIPKDCLDFYAGPKLDKRLQLVNYADRFAHYFHGKSLRHLSEDRKMVDLLNY